jgi:choline monooxygenase
MQHHEQVALIERALALIACAGSERGEPAQSPVERYLDTERFAREVDRVFRRHPLALCPSGALSQPGDSLALDVAGLPLLLVRGEDGRAIGLVNACRHRGTRLQAPGVCNRRAFVCPYHSWTYALDGSLRGRPHDRDFAAATADQCALARVAVGEALGFVWAVPRVLQEREPDCLDLTTYLGRFASDLRGWGYDTWVPFHQREFANAANWKIPFEGNLETYHFQYAHKSSIAHLFYDNLLIADLDAVGAAHHQRVFLPKRSIESLRDVPREQWQVGPHANIIYFFFPATFLLHEGDHCNVFTVLPEAVDRSRVLATTLIPEPPRTDKARRHWEKNVESFWGALDEDFALGVSSQSTMASGANSVLHLGATEWCSARFHDDVEAVLAGVGPGPGPGWSRAG